MFDFTVRNAGELLSRRKRLVSLSKPAQRATSASRSAPNQRVRLGLLDVLYSLGLVRSCRRIAGGGCENCGLEHFPAGPDKRDEQALPLAYAAFQPHSVFRGQVVPGIGDKALAAIRRIVLSSELPSSDTREIIPPSGESFHRWAFAARGRLVYDVGH